MRLGRAEVVDSGMLPLVAFHLERRRAGFLGSRNHSKAPGSPWSQLRPPADQGGASESRPAIILIVSRAKIPPRRWAIGSWLAGSKEGLGLRAGPFGVDDGPGNFSRDGDGEAKTQTSDPSAMLVLPLAGIAIEEHAATELIAGQGSETSPPRSGRSAEGQKNGGGSAFPWVCSGCDGLRRRPNRRTPRTARGAVPGRRVALLEIDLGPGAAGVRPKDST